MTFFNRMTSLFRPARPVDEVLVKDSSEIDQAFNGLVKAIVKNSRGLSRTRILAAVESLRSVVKATYGSE